MIDRLVETVRDLDLLIRFIGKQKRPFRATIKDGRPRSLDQNALQWKWAYEAGVQRGMTTREVQNEWKLHIGVPLMRAENEGFARAWEPIAAKLTFEEQLDHIQYVEVTSAMSVDQLKRYLDEVRRVSAENGIELTDPEESCGFKKDTGMDRQDARHPGADSGKAQTGFSARRKMR